MTESEKEMILRVRKSYNIPEELPDLSDQKLVDAITARIMQNCKKELEAADAGVAASLAHASEIWTC